MSMQTRDYECRIFEFSSVVSAATAGKARYRYWLDVSDCFPDVKLTHIKVRALGPTPRYTKQEVAVNLFNALYPIGTLVRFWTGLREGEGRVAKTRSLAQVMCSGHGSVWVEGVAACISLSHVQPIEEY